MPRSYNEPEYRRRIREKAEKQQATAETKDRESSDKNSTEQITAAIHRVEQELYRNHDQQHPHNRSKWRWERAGVLGLWLAALVGVAAILVGSHDADQQVHATRESFEAVQRAYIIVTDLKRFDTSTEKYLTSRYVPIITNVGNTQTRNMAAIVMGPDNFRSIAAGLVVYPPSREQNREFCIAGKLGLPPDPDMFVKYDNLLHATGGVRVLHPIVGPKQIFNIPESDTVESRISYKKLDNNMMSIPDVRFPYFVGQITYNDVFPKTPSHVTKYCFSNHGVQAGGDNQLGGLIFDLCPHWNCADDECEADRKRYDEEAAKIADQCK